MTTKIDLHTHTKASDGIGTPQQIAEAAKRAKLDAICLTDHNVTYHPENLRVAAACRRAGLLVFHGAEYSSGDGHILVYGVDLEDMNFGWYKPMQEVIDAVNAAGGACIPSHPYKGYQRRLEDKVKALNGVRAYETMNGQCEWQDARSNIKATAAQREMKVLSAGGSDAHNPDHIGITYTIFNAHITTEKGFINALRRGHFVAHVDRQRVRAELAKRGKSLDTASGKGHPGVNGPGKDSAYTRSTERDDEFGSWSRR